MEAGVGTFSPINPLTGSTPRRQARSNRLQQRGQCARYAARPHGNGGAAAGPGICSLRRFMSPVPIPASAKPWAA
ncbi:hypothetical protein BRN41_06070, partial [Xanthomonas oryzae pv. oryzae]